MKITVGSSKLFTFQFFNKLGLVVFHLIIMNRTGPELLLYVYYLSNIISLSYHVIVSPHVPSIISLISIAYK